MLVAVPDADSCLLLSLTLTLILRSSGTGTGNGIGNGIGIDPGAVADPDAALSLITESVPVADPGHLAFWSLSAPEGRVVVCEVGPPTDGSY